MWTIIIGAVICAILLIICFCNDDGIGSGPIFGGLICGGILGALIGLVVCAIGSNVTTENATKIYTTISSTKLEYLRGIQNTSNKYYLGKGLINNKTYYTYAIIEDSHYKMKQIPNNEYTSEHIANGAAHIDVVHEDFANTNLRNFFWDTNSDVTIINIPAGTVIDNFDFDIQ